LPVIEAGDGLLDEQRSLLINGCAGYRGLCKPGSYGVPGPWRCTCREMDNIGGE
jgi:hypothetical protein